MWCGCCAPFENKRVGGLLKVVIGRHEESLMIPYAGYVGVPVVLYSLEPSGGHNAVAITLKSNHDEELLIPPDSNRHAADYALRVPVTNDLP